MQMLSHVTILKHYTYAHASYCTENDQPSHIFPPATMTLTLALSLNPHQQYVNTHSIYARRHAKRLRHCNKRSFLYKLEKPDHTQYMHIIPI